jgi:4-hydroxy-2-oxoheptanedioate aldolase
MNPSRRRHVRFPVLVTLCALWALSSLPSAQQAPLHLNPVVDKLAQGKSVIGVSTSDLSLENARELARADIDFVRLEMEHGPIDVAAARTFLVGMIDKAAAVKKGNAQPNVAPFVRIAPYGREPSAWLVKQMLDIGMMGIKFPAIDNREQALAVIRSMRYPQLKTSAYREPVGMRGCCSASATWFWGVDDYEEHADLWPLNPRGDLLSILLIETGEGLKNIDEIAAVPGVGIIFAGVLGDMPRSLGVTADAPEMQGANDTILRACQKHKVVCGAPVNPKNIQQRIKEGWRYLDVGGASGGLPPTADAAVRAGRAVLK